MESSDGLITTEDLERWARDRGIAVSMRPTGLAMPSIAAAAAALEITPDQVARGVLTFVRNDPVLVVGPASHRVQLPLVAGELGAANSDVRLAGPAEALRMAGCPMGSMPPFGHARPLTTLMDRSLLSHEKVMALTPVPAVLMEVAPGDIVAATYALVGQFT